MTTDNSGTVSTRDARARAQRDRILDAAQHCFAERGFHGASMAAIADTAQMSAGLIYRYFENKSALIHGIVSRQMELLAHDVQRMGSQSPEEMVTRIVEGIRKGSKSCIAGDAETARHLEPALVLEITAESGRDPVIREALVAFDQRIDAALANWLSTEGASKTLPPEQLAARALILRALLDGLKMRQARDPQMDLALLEKAMRDALPKLIGN